MSYHGKREIDNCTISFSKVYPGLLPTHHKGNILLPVTGRLGDEVHVQALKNYLAHLALIPLTTIVVEDNVNMFIQNASHGVRVPNNIQGPVAFTQM